MLVFETPGAGAFEGALQVDAFAAAAREGNFDAPVAILHPNGARGWTGVVLQPASVNGAAGLGFFHGDSLLGVSAFSIAGGKIVDGPNAWKMSKPV